MTQNGSLSVKQQQLLAALISGKGIEKAAQSVSISPRTAYRWQKLPVFQEELKRGKDELLTQVLDGLYKRGLETLHKHITFDCEPTPGSQIRAVALITEQMWMRQKVDELTAKLDELGQLLEKGGYY